MRRTPKHAKPKEPKPEKKRSPKWFQKNPVAEPVQPSPCVICDTYRARELEPPRGHECTPMTLDIAKEAVLIGSSYE